MQADFRASDNTHAAYTEVHDHDIVRLSLDSTPEKMLEQALHTCIEIAGATGGSILGEEGIHLQFLFSDITHLIGMRVPFDSIAGTACRNGVIIYTHAPSDARHFSGLDREVAGATEYLLSIPIPSIHRAAGRTQARRYAGVLQLLFDRNILPDVDIAQLPREFEIEAFKESDLYERCLKRIFRVLPKVMFGMEVMKLRQTSYQAVHELKNKFISAQSWIRCLKEDVASLDSAILDNANVTEDLSLAESSARDGVELAKNYLAFTRIYDPQFEQGDLAPVIEETAALTRVFAKESRETEVKVLVETASAVPLKSIDPGKLGMALFNLCKNAAEALCENGTPDPTIRISLQHDGERVTVTISDNGPGMPQDIADNLFIPFRTRKEGGTGLGLTITKKIIEMHNGDIRCSTGENGTTFVVTL